MLVSDLFILSFLVLTLFEKNSNMVGVLLKWLGYFIVHNMIFIFQKLNTS